MTDTAVSIAPADKAMPKAVWVPVAMMLVELPVGLIFALFFQSVEIGLVSLVVIVVATIAGLGLIALIAFGYGWVRHLFAIGAILALPRLVFFLAPGFHSAPLGAAWVLTSNLWFYAALVLLYSPSARAWFHESRLRRQRGL